MILRLIEKKVLSALESEKKVLIIYGPRQTGKTTMLKQIRERLPAAKRVTYLNCDLSEDRASIDTTAFTTLNALVRGSDILLIDEAQRLENPGLTLKILHDAFPGLRVVATGSSSFHLKNELSDALTGRFIDYTLYPLALEEIVRNESVSDNPAVRSEQLMTMTDHILLYGTYPEVYQQPLPGMKQQLLMTIAESYLFADILAFSRVRRSETLRQLAQTLAYQIGNEISENELANRLKIDRKTVLSYLDILEQSYVILRLYPFSRNPRREIGRNYKIYFIDVGIRNALIGDFNALAVRADTGALWENFVIMERIKWAANRREIVQRYFWRNYGGAEVDWLEKRINEPMEAFEIKYGNGKLSRGAEAFSKEYGIPVHVIRRRNIEDIMR